MEKNILKINLVEINTQLDSIAANLKMMCSWEEAPRRQLNALFLPVRNEPSHDVADAVAAKEALKYIDALYDAKSHDEKVAIVRDMLRHFGYESEKKTKILSEFMHRIVCKIAHIFHCDMGAAVHIPEDNRETIYVQIHQKDSNWPLVLTVLAGEKSQIDNKVLYDERSVALASAKDEGFAVVKALVAPERLCQLPDSMYKTSRLRVAKFFPDDFQSLYDGVHWYTVAYNGTSFSLDPFDNNVQFSADGGLDDPKSSSPVIAG